MKRILFELSLEAGSFARTGVALAKEEIFKPLATGRFLKELVR